MAFTSCRIFSALLAGILFCSTTCGAQNASSPQVLLGTVQDALARPIPNAIITLNSPTGKSILKTRTNHRGVFILKEAAPGTYLITVWSPAFVPASATVALPQRKAMPIKITLESIPALVLPVTAKRILAQNGLSQSGANRYTLTAKDIPTCPKAKRPVSIR